MQPRGESGLLIVDYGLRAKHADWRKQLERGELVRGVIRQCVRLTVSVQDGLGRFIEDDDAHRSGGIEDEFVGIRQ
jgi:hypothetical protein